MLRKSKDGTRGEFRWCGIIPRRLGWHNIKGHENIPGILFSNNVNFSWHTKGYPFRPAALLWMDVPHLWCVERYDQARLSKTSLKVPSLPFLKTNEYTSTYARIGQILTEITVMLYAICIQHTSLLSPSPLTFPLQPHSVLHSSKNSSLAYADHLHSGETQRDQGQGNFDLEIKTKNKQTTPCPA